ncbi:integrase catalytic domain-containing protein [Trichonephila clavipes]|nr:integrase catalytic domain-containing protein [Trichonephila clavipes]
MSGANSLSEALELQNQLTKMLSSAGLVLRKWKQQLQWDERVPPDITLEWEQLAKDVQVVKGIKIPRFLFVDSDNQFHLFGFSDASEKAYAAAIYCLSVSDTEKINVQLIIAKTRVAPLKPVSLPRLELCGALFC